MKVPICISDIGFQFSVFGFQFSVFASAVGFPFLVFSSRLRTFPSRLFSRFARCNHRSNGPIAFPPKAAVGSATMKLFLTLLFSVVLPATQLLALSDQTTNGKLKLGDPIPTVSATDQDGKPVNLSSASSGYVLVYFYPKAMTPGCTAQACSIRDAYTDLQKK